MRCSPARRFLVMAFTILPFYCLAQKWKNVNHSAGARSFEIQTNVKGMQSVVSMIRDKEQYISRVNSINHNSISNISGVYLNNRNYYWMAEWMKTNTVSRFWKNYSILTGLHISNKKQEQIGYVAEVKTQQNPTLKTEEYRYSIEQQEQSLGAIVGLNRRFKIVKDLQLVTSLQFQGNYTFIHHFHQKIDSISWTSNGGWVMKTIQLPNLAGEKYLHWQMLIPIGLELKINHTPFSIRLEAMAGLTNDQFRKKNNSDKGILGVGAWLLYGW